MCDGELPAVSSKITRTARKEHKCYECGSTINKGEKYEVHNGCWDGEWRSYKWCGACVKMAKGLKCWIYGEMRAYVKEGSEL